MKLQEIIDARNSQATENELKLNVGDVVAIRGDLRITVDQKENENTRLKKLHYQEKKTGNS